MPTLYVIVPGSRLERQANQLAVIDRGDVLARVPVSRVTSVVMATGAGLTIPALQLLLANDIDLIIVSGSGEATGRLTALLDTNVEFRHRQHRCYDDDTFRLPIARAIVAGKITNSRTLVMRWTAGDRSARTEACLDRLSALIGQARAAGSIATLMGIEGMAGREHFAEFSHQLCEPWTYSGRLRRPPPDPVNCVLSVTATLLYSRCIGAIEATGLDPAVGFLHELHRGRASLAVDLMEEFRPLVSESVTLTLFNRRVLEPRHFRTEANGVVLTIDGWEAVASEFERRMETFVRVPGRSTRTTYGKLLEVQAWQFRRLIEGERTIYEPFLVK